MRAIALVGILFTGGAVAAGSAARADMVGAIQATGRAAMPVMPGLATGNPVAELIGAWTGAAPDGGAPDASTHVNLAFGADASVAGETNQKGVTNFLFSGHYSIQGVTHDGPLTEGVMTWFDVTAYPRPSDARMISFKLTGRDLVLSDANDPHDKPITVHRAEQSAAQLGLVPPAQGGAMPLLEGPDPTKAALRAFGLTGAWARDCSRPAATANPYSYYQVPADGPATLTTVLPIGQHEQRTVSEITNAEVLRPGVLRMTSKLVSGGMFKDGYGAGVLYRDQDGLHVWSAHFNGIAARDFGHHKAGEHIDQDTIFMGYFIQPDGKIGIHMPARQRCGDQQPPPANG